MADPRLAWRQLNVAAPNVSGLMSGANDALNNAAEAADGILGRYAAGRTRKADAEVANELAALDTQEEIDAYFAGGGLAGRPVSDEMLQSLMGRQGEVTDFGQTRASTRSTNATADRTNASIGWGNDANSRANAGEYRTNTEWQHGQAQDEWLRGNADQFFDAERGALTNGTAFSAHIDRTESGGGADQYDTLYGHRNRRDGTRVSQMTIGQAGQFAAPSGEYGQSVNSEIGRVATPMGKFQIVGTTLRGLQEDLGLPDDVPFSAPVQEQLGLYLAQQRVNGPRSRQGMRDGLRSEWEGFNDVSDAELDVMIDEIRSMPPVNRDTILAAASGSQPQSGPRQVTQSGFGGDEFTNTMAESGLFNPAEISTAVDPLRQAGTRGDELISQENTQMQNDLLAGITEQVSESYQAINAGEAENMIRDLLLESEQFSQAEAVAAARRGAEMIEQSAGLGANLSGGQLDAGVVGAIEESAANTVADANRRLIGTDQARAVADIQRYSEGEPHTQLEADLSIPEDAQTLGSYRPEMLRRLVNEYADEFGVEPSVVAVAMRDAYTSDPGDDERSSFWYNSDMTLNTLRNRFDPEMVEAAVAQLDPDARRDFDRGQSNVRIIESQLQQNSLQQQQVLRRLNKLDPNNPSHASAIENLRNRLGQLEGRAAALSREQPISDE